MNEKIKILSCYNKPSHLIDSDLFIRVHGGRALIEESGLLDSEKKWMYEYTIGDDTGENISRYNQYYNELTVVYWAWKNYDTIGNPDFIGLTHYRRHFIFKNLKENEGDSWTYDIIYNDNNSYIKYINLNKKDIYNYINKYNCIHTLRKTKESVYNQYKNSLLHNISDLDLVLSIIEEKYPEYLYSAMKYIHGKNNYFCNMFIFKKDIFFKYCEWIFNILYIFNKRRDYENLTYEEMRFFVSERLTGIFIQFLIDNNISHCPLQITLIQNIDIIEDIYPKFKVNNTPIIFSIDDNYLPMLYVTIKSIIDNSKDNNNYDLFILYNSIKEINKIKIYDLLKNKDNFYVRFINISNLLSESIINSFYIEIHVSISTYFRFFIPKIFKNFEKVLYLDSDIIVLNDIADLYNTDIKNNYIGAALDIRESIATKLNMEVSNRKWRDYLENTLGMSNPYQYFQAGVLIYNIKKCIENGFEKKVFEKLQEIKNPILSDQDILNSVCFNNVFYIDTKWNIEWQIQFEFIDYKKYLPAKNYDIYTVALKNPALIHYASSIKPWNHSNYNLSQYWWQYARQTPFYEFFINANTSFNDYDIKKIRRYDFIIKYVKLIIPDNTLRKKVVMYICRNIRKLLK